MTDERKLKASKLLTTIEGIRQRLDKRFPGAGLSLVAGQVAKITEEAVERAKIIARPDWRLRAGLAVAVVVCIVAVVVYTQDSPDQTSRWQSLLQFLDVAKGSAAVLLAAAAFLFTLETRLKRRRTMQAVHELRAVAHIIDMHQLGKNPDRLGDPDQPVLIGESGKPASADDLGRYLHYCTELLAVISKIGQLYVQDFPDTAAMTAVDHFEDLATGLSGKIWQKLMILDRVRSDSGSPAAPQNAANK